MWSTSSHSGHKVTLINTQTIHEWSIIRVRDHPSKIIAFSVFLLPRRKESHVVMTDEDSDAASCDFPFGSTTLHTG